jgi:PhnB protein
MSARSPSAAASPVAAVPDPLPPDGRVLTPYITVRDAARAIEFYAHAFEARELFRLVEPQGRVGHAELAIGGSVLMLSDEYPDFGALSPAGVGGSPVTLHLYVRDVDATLARAEAAGATVLRAAKDEFYGDRSGMLQDPFGHRWMLASRREEVAPQEMQRRWSEALRG